MPGLRHKVPKRTSAEPEPIAVAGHEIAVSNPGKVLFPKPKYTKLDLVRYYLAVAEGALRGAGGRPNVLVRYPNGISGEFFYQKRAPESRPPWIEVVTLQFPSGRTAEEVVPRDAAGLVWLANLACLELHPHPVRAEDLDHPDELRVDLDPVPGVKWPQVSAEPADFTLATMPQRFAKLGDRHEGMDQTAGSLEGLLELSARHERAGLGDAPWPPHFKKQRGEPPRVQPSRARAAHGARAAKYPLIEIARAKRKQDALAGLKRWKARHPKAAKYLEPADVLVDSMRGRSSTWTRIRVNLQHVPPKLRPRQERLDPDEKTLASW